MNKIITKNAETKGLLTDTTSSKKWACYAIQTVVKYNLKDVGVWAKS